RAPFHYRDRAMTAVTRGSADERAVHRGACDSPRVSDGGLSSVLKPGEFLVCYDYGTGGLWGVLVAPSASAISARFPEVVVVERRPDWMGEGICVVCAKRPCGWMTTHRRDSFEP